MAQQSDQLIEHLFRTEYGKLLSILTKFFGSSYLELAEDVVQETLISALNHWSVEGIPDNPSAWLVQVAKRKALNELKRNKMMQKHHQLNLVDNLSSEIDSLFLEDEIEDSQLRMIFTCCHPAIPQESQIALTLKTLCGFGSKEVAKALLNNESTINKRIYRAKETIKASSLSFDIPQGKELDKRLDTVSLTLYLLFNEGYNSASNDSSIRKDLCLEAVRLTQLLVRHFNENTKLCALLSLMCFHTARFDARIDDHGAIILFEDQNRSLWNVELIQIGMQYLKKSMKGEDLSAYHIEANIAAHHCTAVSFKDTNWESIYHQYQLLKELKPNPVILLNLAIIQSQIKGYKSSLKELAKLSEHKILSNYHLLPATQGIFNMKIGNIPKAMDYLNLALSQNPPMAEKHLLEKKRNECKKLLPKI